jgi:hypothetical protein
MYGSRSSGLPDKPFQCATCGLHLGLSIGDQKRGVVPWHFDARPLQPGKDREGCPSAGDPIDG